MLLGLSQREYCSTLAFRGGTSENFQAKYRNSYRGNSQLVKNLSPLSTSAPAPRSGVGRSVFRRGTCDRGIWTKPLAFAADAEGYINIMVWGFNGRFAISSPLGHANCQFC